MLGQDESPRGCIHGDPSGPQRAQQGELCRAERRGLALAPSPGRTELRQHERTRDIGKVRDCGNERRRSGIDERTRQPGQPIARRPAASGPARAEHHHVGAQPKLLHLLGGEPTIAGARWACGHREKRFEQVVRRPRRGAYTGSGGVLSG